MFGAGLPERDVAVHLGHTDGGALVMSTYGQPTESGARERLKSACGPNVSSFGHASSLAREAQNG
jgi:hypothetical protein